MTSSRSGGYVALSWVLTGLALVALILLTVDRTPSITLSILVALIVSMALIVTSVTVSIMAASRSKAERKAKKTPKVNQVPERTAAPVVEETDVGPRTANLDIELDNLAPEPVQPIPQMMPEPTPQPAPQARVAPAKEHYDYNTLGGEWPVRETRNSLGQTTGVQGPRSSVNRQHLANKYTGSAPMVREILREDEDRPVKEVFAKPAKGPLAHNAIRGKCGSCGLMIDAPKFRPVKVRCPRCSKTTLMR